MILYNPLWETMKRKKVTTYTLRNLHNISGATFQRMKKDMPVSTYTLDKLCKILSCDLSDAAEYIPDAKKQSFTGPNRQKQPPPTVANTP